MLTRHHYPNEFGGFLFGRYSENNNHLTVTDMCVPVLYRSSPMLFDRNTDGLKEFEDNDRSYSGHYYIGEWHSHPNGSLMFSMKDLKAMRKIESHETVYIKNPVLLILSIDISKGLDFKFYLYDKGEMTPYEQN